MKPEMNDVAAVANISSWRDTLISSFAFEKHDNADSLRLLSRFVVCREQSMLFTVAEPYRSCVLYESRLTER